MLFNKPYKVIFLLFLRNQCQQLVYALNESVLDSDNMEANEIIKYIDKRRDRYDSVEITTPEDHPYAVMLFLFKGSDYLGCCSGSLVTLEWVLTAASHCFLLKNTTSVEVYAGGNSEKEWLEKNYTIGYQLRNTTEFYIHPSYKREGFSVSYFDIALVKVEKFNKTRTVSTVKIYPKPWEFKGFTSCTLTGFGKDQFGEKQASDFVRKTYYLQAKSPCVCLNTSETKLNHWICSKPRKDFGICESDWGAALVCNGKIRGVAVVVTSFKNLDTCTRDDHREYVCASDKTLSIFQNTLPCVEWLNNYVDRLKAAPKSGGNKEQGSHTVLFIIILCQIFIVYIRRQCLSFFPRTIESK